MTTLDHFTRNIEFDVKHTDYTELDTFIPNIDTFKALTFLEKVAIHNRIPIAELLITYLHQSQLPYNQYIATNPLLKELRNKFNLYASSKNTNKIYDSIINYIYQYQRLFGKKLPLYNEQNGFTPFNDNPQLILSYIIGINETIRRINNNIQTPLQLDTFFIEPNNPKIAQFGLHSLKLATKTCVKSDAKSREDEEQKVDVIRNVQHLLYNTLTNSKPCERYVMVIVRGNQNNVYNDTIYIFKSKQTLPSHLIADNSELIFLLNSKHEIIPGLLPNDSGILSLNHHLHSYHSNKVFLSLGVYKQRIFKKDILSKLMILCNNNTAISPRNRIEFEFHYRDIRDIKYEIGTYWFEIKFDEDTKPTEQATQVSNDVVSFRPDIADENKLLIKFVTCEAITNTPTDVPFHVHDVAFTQCEVFDNADSKYDDENNENDLEDITELESADADEYLRVPWGNESDTDDDDDDADEHNGYDQELNRMICELNAMNRELQGLGDDAANIEHIQGVEHAIQLREIENMQENANNMYDTVCAYQYDSQQ